MRFKENEVVRLKRSLILPGEESDEQSTFLSKGTKGTVIFVWEDSNTYLIEFKKEELALSLPESFLDKIN